MDRVWPPQKCSGSAGVQEIEEKARCRHGFGSLVRLRCRGVDSRVGGGLAHDSLACIKELEVRGAMVPEGGVELAAGMQTGPNRGKNSLEAVAARLDARRGPLQHGGGEYGKAAQSARYP